MKWWSVVSLNYMDLEIQVKHSFPREDKILELFSF